MTLLKTMESSKNYFGNNFESNMKDDVFDTSDQPTKTNREINTTIQPDHYYFRYYLLFFLLCMVFRYFSTWTNLRRLI